MSLHDVSRDLRKYGGAPLARVADELSLNGGHRLRGIDLLSAYDPEKITQGAGRSWWRLVRILEILRDSLVFVPVAFTWWQVALALSAYGATDGRVPFLLAWQRGLPGVSPLSDSATAISLMVGAVVVLTLIIRAADEIRESRQRKLGQALARATLLVAEVPVESGQAVSLAELKDVGTQIRAGSSELSAELRKATQTIGEAVSAGPGSQLHAVFTSWLEAADRLAELTASLKGSQETADELARLQRALSAEVERFTSEATDFLATLRDERTMARDQAHVQNKVADGVARSTAMLGDSLQALNERTHLFHEIVSRISDVVTRLEGVSENGHRSRSGW
ncbi:hypothetical protein GCM10010404_30250 [Nonomuraea africana]|uniref:Cell division septum initiation protein DivIVA n=1 Tax=Nonomuraea africana TaxID=46171 RepID=A0ABR9KFI7_9ACTN|nr:hypothetical protein [Nonomuraea africana]MBE1560744.1 cell division septum initiation protein DivIVA [Nonomuraea africana]